MVKVGAMIRVKARVRLKQPSVYDVLSDQGSNVYSHTRHRVKNLPACLLSQHLTLGLWLHEVLGRLLVLESCKNSERCLGVGLRFCTMIGQEL